MNGKRRLILPAVVLAAAIAGALWALSAGKTPFRGLTAEEIERAQVSLTPPGVTIELDRGEIGELAGLLNAAVVYRRDQSYAEYDGQGVVYDLELRDGTVLWVMPYNPFLVIDGTGYRAKYEPCEALSSFGNRLRAERGS